MGQLCTKTSSSVGAAAAADAAENNRDISAHGDESGQTPSSQPRNIDETTGKDDPLPLTPVQQHTVYRLLLLGAAESGKTTVLEQIRLLYNRAGYTETERYHTKMVIFGNVFAGLQKLAKRAIETGVDWEKPRNRNLAIELIDDQTEHEGPFEDDTVEKMLAVWNDTAVQKIYARRSEFNLNDSTKYFLDNLERINDEDYRVTPHDLIMAYIPTVGTQNVIFTAHDASYQLFDVGGQKVDRKKWATMYDGLSAIIFCIAISEYNQVLREDLETNCIDDALSLLERCCAEPKFARTPIFVFLNETDVFSEKLVHFPLSAYMPAYAGSTNDQALTFMEELVRSKTTAHPNVELFFTVAIDTDRMAAVLDNVFQTIAELDGVQGDANERDKKG